MAPRRPGPWGFDLDSDALFRALFEKGPDPILISDDAGRIHSLNPAAEELFGERAEALRDRPLGERFEAAFDLSLGLVGRLVLHRADGGRRHVEALTQEVTATGLRVTWLRERSGEAPRASETRQRELEGQLIQAQKMDAVGRLAGGVAHDFNNMLSVILGYCELLGLKLDDGDERRRDLEEISTAAGRAAQLTQQLLAFSRKQLLEPETLSLNEVVLDMTKMLRRVLGEDVTLETRLAGDLNAVRVDRSQFEQTILNAAINSRDALPQGGALTIETENLDLTPEDAARLSVSAPGPAVRLTLRDDGEGMTEDTRRRAFEPFFTTKERGRGTGLGLSTAYGIVKQSGGGIFLESSPGNGTSLSIYLPAAAATPAHATGPVAVTEDLSGSETILLAEDDADVRRLAASVLRMLGYRVFEAADGAEALAFARASAATTIDLLVTDVVMPILGGPELARTLQAERPGLPVLFISGYTEDALGTRGVLEPGVLLLMKPLTVTALGRKVREALSSTARRSALPR